MEKWDKVGEQGGQAMLKVRCQARATVDDKGRLSLPSAIRRALDEATIPSLVFCAYQGAIWGWTPNDYARIEGRMEGVDPFSVASMDFVHAVLAVAEEVELDKAGRVRLPGELREMAGITRDVQVFSVLDRIEVWDAARWDERFREARERAPLLGGMPGGNSGRAA